MKRKIPPTPEPVVAPEIMEGAKALAMGERPARRVATKCVVCQSETSPNSNEGLCWVCRRLKISAWRDSDTQMPAQE